MMVAVQKKKNSHSIDTFLLLEQYYPLLVLEGHTPINSQPEEESDIPTRSVFSFSLSTTS